MVQKIREAVVNVTSERKVHREYLLYVYISPTSHSLTHSRPARKTALTDDDVYPSSSFLLPFVLL